MQAALRGERDADVPCDSSALVAAVAAANAAGGPDVLSLAPNCVYTLTAPAVAGGEDGLPAIVGKLTIHGNGATVARAADAPRFRLISNWGDLGLDHITLTGGHAPDAVGTRRAMPVAAPVAVAKSNMRLIHARSGNGCSTRTYASRRRKSCI